ncbi:hypothetical protein M434DRAFT_401183 [Hypoxylon sp. CO27-5]|nr:hypothetical protein M434DRAFT_401183 [Hypoxylon sp. CO27-5]
MENFPYPPLPLGEEVIRLLTIEPGGFDDQIICTLNQVSLNTKPKYAALSYAWDNPYPDRAKLCTEMPNPEGLTKESTGTRGQSSPDTKDVFEPTPEDSAMDEIDGPGTIIVDSHQFSVKHNLFLALRHLRSSKDPLVLWVDAICINQNNIEERNTHVVLMSFIYKRAALVVAWLGPQDYAKDYPSRSDQLHMMRTAWEKGSTQCLEAYVKYPESVTRQTLDGKKFRGSSYWTRLWIIQEVSLASKLVFVHGSDVFIEWKFWGYSNIEPVLKIRERRHSEGMTLEYLVQAFSYAACNDIRDRIYGILGLVHGVIPYARTDQATDTIDEHFHPADTQNESLPNPPQHEGMLKVDYAQSLYGVWIDVVRYLSFRANGIGTNDILELFNIVKKPKWGFNYHFTYLREDLQSLNIVKASGIIQDVLKGRVEEEKATHDAKESIFSTSNQIGKANRSKCEQQDFMITATGYLGGEILAVGPSNPQSCSSYQEWLYCLESSVPRPKDDIEILRKTNEQYMSKISNYSDRRLSRIQGIMNPRIIGWNSKESRTRSSDPEYVAKYNKIWEYAGDQLAQPKLCVCTGNQVALVPSATRPRDVIVRFWGCSTAIVMRPYKGSFMLIGRADVAEVEKNTIIEHYTLSRHTHFLNGLSGAFSPTHRRTGLNSALAPGAIHVDLDMSTLQLITAPM